MTQPFIKNIFFIIVSCILFFADLLLFAYLQKHLIDLLFCFFIILLVSKQQNLWLITSCILLSIVSYLDSNIFGWSLLYTMPIIIIAQYFEQQLHVKWIIPYLLLTSGLCIKFIVNFFIHHIAISSIHTTEIIIYNILALSLGIIIKKRLENKFQAFNQS